MQLKGLVRFFTVLLIVYSLYQLSFTWLVKNHEKKMEAKARNYVKIIFKVLQQNILPIKIHRLFTRKN